ncbi:MAG: LCP family protein [Actinomycetota bacterium]|nr:LCP family protein [Actinomycetota bacterium]
MVEVAPGARLRRTWPQRLLIGFNILLIVVCLATAIGLGYVGNRVGRLQRVALGHVLAPTAEAGAATSGVRTFLIVGTDNAEELDEDDPVLAGRNVGSQLTDTIMLLRVDPAAERAALLSLPRDLWLPIAGTGSNQRINAAYSVGGPDTLIETINDSFGIEVNHYVQVDLAGFKDLVAAIDGVPIYAEYPMRDLRSGLAVDTEGCVVLDPDQSLAYARSRAFQWFDGDRWRTDGSGDLGRISRQQDFIKRAMSRAISRGVRNPITLDQLVEVGLDAVTVDERLTPGDLVDLARDFGDFDPRSLETYALPVSFDTVGGASIVRLLEDQAQPVLDVFRGVGATGTDDSDADDGDGDGGPSFDDASSGDPASDDVDVEPEDVELTVLNGTGLRGQAGEVGDAFEDAGFVVDGVADADESGHALTEVRHGDDAAASAALVRSYLEGAVRVVSDDDLDPTEVVVVTGATYGGVLDEPVRSGGEPTSTTSRPTTTTTSTTTTTVLGQVPAEPEGVATCN